MKTKIFIILVFWVSILMPKNIIKLDLTRQLELGKNDIFFESIEHVTEDHTGKFYVLDKRAYKVYKFSKDGSLMLKFGNKGQGPGDFISPHKIHINDDGGIIVCELSNFVSVFGKHGKFRHWIKEPTGIDLHYLNNNLFYVWTWTPEGKKQSLVNRSGKTKKTFYSVSRKDFSINVTDEKGNAVMFNFFTEEYSPFLLFDRYRDHSVIGVSNKYEFVLINENGDILRKISRDIKPGTISKKEKECFKDVINSKKHLTDTLKKKFIRKIPRHKNYIRHILISEKHIWIFRIKENVLTDKVIPVDIYSLEGKFIGTAKIKDVPIFISTKYIYFSESDKDDDLLLVRYNYNI